MPLQIGDSVGDYIVLGRLGSGGSGDVFRVEHSITKRIEAMKILNGPIPEDRAERILREAKMQARLSHPNITALHNAFWWKGGLALVMELVDGQPLREILFAGAIPVPCAVHYVRQILLALEHAHQHGVVHRDISPANILISEGDRVKLTDFGLAKDPADRRITQTGAVLGSIHYSAPEQIRSSDEANHRADIYSCGVLFYEMFTGTRPFDGETAFELMLAHAEKIPPRPCALKRDLPRWVDDVLVRALEKKPAQRFSSAAEFLQAIDRNYHREIPAWLVAAAAFSAISIVYGGLAVRQLLRIPVLPPPPMPRVAINTPPIDPPPLSLSAPPPEQPKPQATFRPSPQTGITRTPLFAERRLLALPLKARIIGEESPTPAPYQLPRAQATPQAEPAPIPPQPVPLVSANSITTIQPPPRLEEPKLAEPPPERPGRFRGLVNRVNPFRRRASQ